MKNALWLAGCCVLAGHAVVHAQSATAPSAPSKVSPATNPTTGGAIAGASEPLQPAPSAPSGVGLQPANLTDPANIPTTDPEAIAAQSVAFAREKEATQNSDEEMEAEAQQQKQAEAQHDWMLRDYQQRLREQGLEKEPAAESDQDANGATKDSSDPASDIGTDPLLANILAMDKAAKQPAPARDAPTVDLENKVTPDASLAPTSLPPLLPPIASTANPESPTHDFFGGTANDQTSEADQPNQADTPAPSSPEDAALDVPGMTAAQQGGLIDPGLSLDDHLPDDTSPTAAAHEDPNDDKAPTAPLNDIDAFYKKQAAGLAPPTAPTLQTSPVALTLPKTYEPPPPMAKPAMDGLRNHVADPFDFLNR